jgi:hypothetical protein
MLLTYTDADQINISFTAESSTGKSYIPLELAWYFPKEDIIEYSYVSPTAFFHEYGTLIPDPSDTRTVEDEARRKIVKIDLSQKILIFVDQPHDMLLQRLRPLLSHDRKTLVSKITDHSMKGGLRTKTAVIEGFPTVIFCTAKFSMEDQERSRLLLLSPETSQAKIKDSIILKIHKDSDRAAFQVQIDEDPQRKLLATRVQNVKNARIKSVIIPEELRLNITEEFFKSHACPSPRNMRDVGRLMALIKANALLNFNHRQRVDDNIIAIDEDVHVGFKLYTSVSTANELGLPPAVYETFKSLEPEISEGGITRREMQKLYYDKFNRVIGVKRLELTLKLLESVGLITEEPDPADHRQKRIFIVKKLNTPEGGSNTETYTPQHGSKPEEASETSIINTPAHGGSSAEEIELNTQRHGGRLEEYIPEGYVNSSEIQPSITPSSSSTTEILHPPQGVYISIPDVYAALRSQLKPPFHQQLAHDLIAQLKQCTPAEAEQVFNILVDDQKLFRDNLGLWCFP